MATLIDAHDSRFLELSALTRFSEAAERPGLVMHNQVLSDSESLPAIGTCQDPVSDSYNEVEIIKGSFDNVTVFRFQSLKDIYAFGVELFTVSHCSYTGSIDNHLMMAWQFVLQPIPKELFQLLYFRNVFKISFKVQKIYFQRFSSKTKNKK